MITNETCGYCISTDPQQPTSTVTLSAVSSPHPTTNTNNNYYQAPALQSSSQQLGSGSQLIESSTAGLTALVQSSSVYYHNTYNQSTTCCSGNCGQTATLYQNPGQQCYYCYKELSCPAGFNDYSTAAFSPLNMTTSSYGHHVPNRMVMSASSPRDFESNSSPYSNYPSNYEDDSLMARSVSGGAISAMTGRRLLPPLPFDAERQQTQNHENISAVNLSRNPSFQQQDQHQQQSAFQRNAPLRISAGAPRGGPAQRAANRAIYGNNGNYMNMPNSVSGPELQQVLQQTRQHTALDSPCASEPGVFPSAGDSLKSRLAELESERNRLQTELTSLSHHCSWAIRNRNDSYVEVEKLKNELQMVRMKSHQELQAIVERLAAKEHEYSLVMSERDTVLQELEDLQDKLIAAEKKAKTLEGENESLKAALDLANRNVEKAQTGGNDMEVKIVSLEQILTEKCNELESVRLRCEWAISERERMAEERDRLRALTEQLMRERDDSNQRVADLTGQLEDLASDSSKPTNRGSAVQRTVTSSSSTSSSMNNASCQRNNRSRDSAIDSDADLNHAASLLTRDSSNNHIVNSQSDSDENGINQTGNSRMLGVLREQPTSTQPSVRAVLPLPVEWPPGSAVVGQQLPATSPQITQSASFPPSTPRSLRRPHLAGGIDDFTLRKYMIFCESLPLLGDQSDQAFSVVEHCIGLKLENCEPKANEAIMFGPVVTSVDPASPAHLAGVESGDRLVEVGGVDVRGQRTQTVLHVLAQHGPEISLTLARNSSPKSASFSISPHSIRKAPSRSNSMTKSQQAKAARYIYISRPEASYSSEQCDIELIGGNISGIFVGALAQHSDLSGLKSLEVGDQILEINGVSLRGSTLENAYVELNRPGEELVILAQSNPAKFETTLKRTRSINGSGDGFYVRCLVDWQAAGVIVSPDASDAPFYLPLQKDAVLYVDNTMPDRGHRSVGGFWSAWVLDSGGQPVRRGLIPSKLRFEDEPSLLLRRSTVSLNNAGQHQNLPLASSQTPRSSTRRLSNFIRRARLSSSAILSKLPRPGSNVEPHSNNGALGHPSAQMMSSTCSWSPEVVYQRVEPLDRSILRPVVILSPVADAIIYRLVAGSPTKYEALQTDIRPGSHNAYSPSYSSSSLSYFVAADISRSLHHDQNDDVIKCQGLGPTGHLETFSLTQLSNASKHGRHCLMDIGPMAIERLVSRRIFPIVIFVKHGSANQLKRLKGADDLLMPRRLSRNSAADLFDQFVQIESEYRHLISSVYVVDSKRDLSVDCLASQIGVLIDVEQQKQQWIPSQDPL